jgi:peptidoglycan/xylan/chitin deacetylase (PgdA/CDA1 family)
MLFTLLFISLLIGCDDNGVDEERVVNVRPQIVLTFDDAFINNWYEVKDELVLKGVPATFFVSYYGNDAISSNPREIDQRNKLLEIESLGFEVANHSFSHARANEYSESYGLKSWFLNEVKRPVCDMLEDGFSIYSFAYPHSNSHNENTHEILLNEFDSIRLYSIPSGSIYVGVYESYSKAIMSARIDNQVAELTEIKEAIDYIYENNLTLILTGHDIANNSESNLFTTPERLFATIDYAREKGIRFIPFRKINNNKLLNYNELGCKN